MGKKGKFGNRNIKEKETRKELIARVERLIKNADRATNFFNKFVTEGQKLLAQHQGRLMAKKRAQNNPGYDGLEK